jgi:hypothetical protein
MPTNPTLNIALKNSSNSCNVFAHITGLDINGGFKPAMIQADGATVYRPVSPSAILQPLQADCAIALGPPGSTRMVTIPQLAGGRIWFSTSGPLHFLVNPGPAIVEPSATNTSDPNYNLNWGFCEFTYNQDQLYVNVSYVDFVSVPISLRLQNSAGVTSAVQGLPAGALDAVCAELSAQDARDKAGWSRLVVRNAEGTANLRALSPNAGIVMNPGLFDGYYQPYVDAVWAKYRQADLVVDTQSTWGTVKGRVDADGKLCFPGVGSFAQPEARDVFSCSTGPFGGYPCNAAEMGNIGARLAAAFNRSTLLVNADQPDGERLETFYKDPITNHYSRICHQASADGRGYAFPYDDVGSSGIPDQSGSLWDGSPTLLTVSVGGPVEPAMAKPAVAADL